MDFEPDDNEFPLAYLLTVRCYGTWLHGDERGSIDRHGDNVYGAPRLLPNKKLKKLMRQEMMRPPLLLNRAQRDVVEAAIRQVCQHRKYDIKAISVRSNHMHVVVSAHVKPELIQNAFKSYATRKLREMGILGDEVKVWARGGSRRYLWKSRHVLRAIEYVLYEQGE